MDLDCDCLLLTLKNTIYWDGAYVLDRSESGWGYQGYQCDFCFRITARIGDSVIVDLFDCQDREVVRFCISSENVDVSPAAIGGDYLHELKGATACLQSLDEPSSNRNDSTEFYHAE
jgi:hypothetical protein